MPFVVPALATSSPVSGVLPIHIMFLTVFVPTLSHSTVPVPVSADQVSGTPLALPLPVRMPVRTVLTRCSFCMSSGMPTMHGATSYLNPFGSRSQSSVAYSEVFCSSILLVCSLVGSMTCFSYGPLHRMSLESPLLVL